MRGLNADPSNLTCCVDCFRRLTNLLWYYLWMIKAWFQILSFFCFCAFLLWSDKEQTKTVFHKREENPTFLVLRNKTGKKHTKSWSFSHLTSNVLQIITFTSYSRFCFSHNAHCFHGYHLLNVGIWLYCVLRLLQLEKPSVFSMPSSTLIVCIL